MWNYIRESSQPISSLKPAIVYMVIPMALSLNSNHLNHSSDKSKYFSVRKCWNIGHTLFLWYLGDCFNCNIWLQLFTWINYKILEISSLLAVFRVFTLSLTQAFSRDLKIACIGNADESRIILRTISSHILIYLKQLFLVFVYGLWSNKYIL